jgi:hypothetical protein
MNAKVTRKLRALLHKDMPSGISPQHQSQMWTIIKKSYNKLSSTDRHPDKVVAALAKVMGQGVAQISGK